MEDPLSYPLAIRQQGALFERNPVCALAYRVCMDMCEEYGGLLLFYCGHDFLFSLERIGHYGRLDFTHPPRHRI